MSSEVVSVAQNAASITTGKKYGGYSKVILHVADDVAYTVGDDTGLTMEYTMPFGTPEMAKNILETITGYQHKAFDAKDVILDPAAQLGDALDVNGVHGGIFDLRSKFGQMFHADASAPEIKQIDQTHKYKSSQERQVERDFISVYAKLSIQADQITAEVEARKSDVETINAQLTVQAGEISAKVSKTGGNSQSFGWKLLDDSWTVDANGQTVFQVTEDGAEVKGKIIAVEGFIGDLEIKDGSISYNNQTWGGTNSKGLYVGPSGIQLGNKFSVDDRGYLRAENGEFNGWVRAGRIDYGGDAGYFDGSGLADGSVYGGSGGKIGGGSISTFNTTGGINTSLGYADWSRGCLNGSNTAPNVKADVLTVDGNFFYKGNLIRKNTATVTTPSGPKTLNYLSWG